MPRDCGDRSKWRWMERVNVVVARMTGLQLAELVFVSAVRTEQVESPTLLRKAITRAMTAYMPDRSSELVDFNIGDLDECIRTLARTNPHGLPEPLYDHLLAAGVYDLQIVRPNVVTSWHFDTPLLATECPKCKGKGMWHTPCHYCAGKRTDPENPCVCQLQDNQDRLAHIRLPFPGEYISPRLLVTVCEDCDDGLIFP